MQRCSVELSQDSCLLIDPGTFRRAIGTAEICNRTPTALLILMSIIMLSAWKDGRNLILRKN